MLYEFTETSSYDANDILVVARNGLLTKNFCVIGVIIWYGATRIRV